MIRASAATGEDPFAKVTGHDRSAAERGRGGGHAQGDEEMAETKTKKEDLDATMEKLNTKIDKWTADIAKLKEEVASLQAELAALATSQAEMDALRQKEHEEYLVVKKELEDGFEGITMARPLKGRL